MLGSSAMKVAQISSVRRSIASRARAVPSRNSSASRTCVRRALRMRMSCSAT